jgi:leader peptidase (prepilin peptidase)/N-methyltransferase
MRKCEAAQLMSETALWIISLPLAILLAWITLVDLRSFRIPDLASLTLVLSGLLFGVLTGGLMGSVLGAAFGYGVFASLGAAFFYWRGQDGLGLGDAKLLAGAGAWLGWQALPLVVAIAACAALGFALLTRQRKLAFGPWLAGAFWILWMIRITA